MADDLEAPEAEAVTEQTNARPDWLPDNFTSPEALADSYRHAQQKISEQGARLSEMEQTLQDMAAATTTQQTTQTAQTEWERLQQAYADASDEGNTTAMLGIQDYMTNLRVQAALDEFKQQLQPAANQPNPALDAAAVLAEQQIRSTYPDYDQVQAEIADTLRTYPGLVQEQTVAGITRGLDAAYRLVKAPTLISEHRAATDAAEQSRLAKIQAQTISGAGGRPPAPDAQKAVWDQIKNAGGGRFTTG